MPKEHGDNWLHGDFMTEIDTERLSLSDIIPRWREAGLDIKLAEWGASNYTLDFIIGNSLMGSHIQPANATKEQMLQFIADMQAIGLCQNVEVWGEVLPVAIQRPAAPAGLGMNADNIWFTPPDPLVGIWRWYVNGVLKATQADYNVMARATLGCVAGDLVQVCEVSSEGVCGWWAKIVVT